MEIKLQGRRFFCWVVAWHALLCQANSRNDEQVLQIAESLLAADSAPRSRWTANDPGIRRATERQQDRMLAQLKRIQPQNLQADEAKLVYAVLRQRLESSAALRVCRTELWDISHIGGWQSEIVNIKSDDELPAVRRFVDTQIGNLRRGLSAGYSVPGSIVNRVIRQIDSISTKARPAFAPLLNKYRSFLQSEYLPKARNSLGLSALPNGGRCYAALLQHYTTLSMSPKEVFAEGQRMVRDSTAEVAAIGRRLYRTDDLAAIVEKLKAEPSNRFRSSQELVDFSANLMEKAREQSSGLFSELPSQRVRLEPLPPYLADAGVPSHYEGNSKDTQPATFWIALNDWSSETRGAAAIRVVHETWPGHHVQTALARTLGRSRVLRELGWNAAYVEGWANYAERLAEEAGINAGDAARIQRRVILGRGLVLDTGIHALGWTRDQALRYAMEAGLSREVAEETIDRAVVEPGQFASYEIGGMAIWHLREEARARFGVGFDLKEFHQHVLEAGPLPLSVLRDRIRALMRP